MRARSPEEICLLFRESMARGDVDALLSLYDPQVAFVNEAGEVKSGLDALREELAPIAARKPRFDFEVKQIAQSGDIALMHTLWNMSSDGRELHSVHAIEVASRQPDGSWRWRIGDPFTVRRLAKRENG
jgi:uncharacterized protein (TIGR02246 family)